METLVKVVVSTILLVLTLIVGAGLGIYLLDDSGKSRQLDSFTQRTIARQFTVHDCSELNSSDFKTVVCVPIQVTQYK